jgi:hypothetical protein
MRKLALGLTLIFASAGLTSGAAHAAGAVGQVTHLSGLLSVKRADGSGRVLSTKSEIQEGDTLNTEQDTYARVKFSDGGEVVLRPGTQLKVAAYSFDAAKPQSDSIILNMFKGGLRAVTGLVGKRSRDSVSFGTATATIGIRGTHFGALMCNNDCGGVATTTGQPPPNGLHVDVTDGAIVVRNAGGQQIVGAGQFGYVRDASSQPAIVPPQQGVQVTMPPAISSNSAAGRGVGKAKDDQCTVQ